MREAHRFAAMPHVRIVSHVCLCAPTRRFTYNWREIQKLTDQAYHWAYEASINKDMGDSQFLDPDMRKADTNGGYCRQNGALDQFIPFTAQVRAFCPFFHPSVCINSLHDLHGGASYNWKWMRWTQHVQPKAL